MHGWKTFHLVAHRIWFKCVDLNSVDVVLGCILSPIQINNTWIKQITLLPHRLWALCAVLISSVSMPTVDRRNVSILPLPLFEYLYTAELLLGCTYACMKTPFVFPHFYSFIPSRSLHCAEAMPLPWKCFAIGQSQIRGSPHKNLIAFAICINFDDDFAPWSQRKKYA